jgi:DMSO/TMAO reductase YedYZ molybdopterin-dependent catalytic subunit
MAPHTSSRRAVLKQLGLVGVGLSIADLPGWVLPALAQGETLVPFTDIPANVRWEVPPDRRTLDIQTISGPFTRLKDKFFTTQHYGHPEVDGAAYKLKVTGLVNQTKSFSLDDLRRWVARTDRPRLRSVPPIAVR